jgi:hypothetical protein
MLTLTMTRRNLFLMLPLTVLCCVPVQSQPPPAKAPVALTFTVMSYALPKADAQTALAGLSAGVDAVAAMKKISGNKAAKATALVALSGRSGQRSVLKSPQVKIEVDPVVGPDGFTVSFGADISVNGKPVKISHALVPAGNVHYAGMIETPGSDVVDAVFVRVQMQ